MLIFRDGTWPGLQADEGDGVTFAFQANDVPGGTIGTVVVNATWSGAAYNVADLRSTGATYFSCQRTVRLRALGRGSPAPASQADHAACAQAAPNVQG